MKPAHPLGQGIPQNQGEPGTQWVRMRGFAGAGDKSAFRAQEAFDGLLLKRHIYFGFPRTDPLRQKGHLSLADTKLTPRTQRVRESP